VVELIALRLPSEDYERMFRTWTGWARHGGLFAYDEVSGAITPQVEEPAGEAR
jgi:hypothetical protein